jgi:hypothetical protein
MSSVPDTASVPSAERERGIEKTDELRRLKKARNRKFESISLQRGVACEPEDDIDIPVRRGSTITIRSRFGSPHRVRRVGGEDLADNEPVKQHPNRRQVQLHRGLGVRGLRPRG